MKAIAQGYDVSRRWLENAVFPIIIRFSTHAYFITFLMLLLLPLELDASNTALALALGNLTNVVSASVAAIVLAQQQRQSLAQQDQHDAHMEQLRVIHAHLRGEAPLDQST